jgi:hypothetical protein
VDATMVFKAALAAVGSPICPNDTAIIIVTVGWVILWAASEEYLIRRKHEI